MRQIIFKPRGVKVYFNMSFLDYFKEKVIFIIINIIVLIITSYLLFGLNVSSYAIILICILNFLASILFLFMII